MSRDEVFDRLEQVFRDVFDDDSIVLYEDTTADDIDDWDSIEHITLIAAVEKEFGMRFSMGEVSGMKAVGEMVSILQQRASK